MIEWLDAWVTALVFALAMLALWSIGWRRGRRSPREPGEDPGMKFTDASIAVLGLLLAFTFSMSLGRHDQRRQAAVAESDAIGDFFTSRPCSRSPAVEAADGHAQVRPAQARHGPSIRTETDREQAIGRCQEMQARIGPLLSARRSRRGRRSRLLLTNTLNNLTSSDAARVAADQEKLPWIIVALLFLGSVVPAFLMGLHQGASHKGHFSGTFCFIFLVTLVIVVTLDLNQPAQGFITVNNGPLERLIQWIGKVRLALLGNSLT